MSATSIAPCRDCGNEFSFAPDEHTFPSPRGPVIVAPLRCPACAQKRRDEEEALYAAAKQDISRAHAYRCRGCRRRFLLLRAWKRAGGLLFCPDCRPTYFQRNPLDAALNQHHGYPQF